MQITWTRLPFRARNREEFSRELPTWLGKVFYEILPAQGYEIREEQIYTTFRMARAFADGQTLFAEAGSGTGKTFAYLLPAVCYARFRGKPVIVSSASGVLQAQLLGAQGDIQELSRILDLQIDARLASDPSDYLCKVKANRFTPERPAQEWVDLRLWSQQTRTGARSEVPDIPDEMWEQVAWDASLPCDTCKHRGTCHPMAARRHYRAAPDIVVTDHRLFARDLLSRAERQDSGQLALLPPYSAVVLDEGHHVPEIWQRAQGYQMRTQRLAATLNQIRASCSTRLPEKLAEALQGHREYLVGTLLPAVQQASAHLLDTVLAAAGPGEGKRHIPRTPEVLEAAMGLTQAVEALQDKLVTEEATQEGTDEERVIRAYQARLDELVEALTLFRSQEVIPWVEGEDLWVVPKEQATLHGPGRLPARMPLLFSSATLQSAYMARVLNLDAHEHSQVGVPFNLGSQVLVYQPESEGDEIQQVQAIMQAMGGRTLVLLNSMADVQRYRAALKVPWRVLFEGDGDRGAMLETFRADVTSCLIGATFWEGVDVTGESLSCVVIPRLPFPPHDPLIEERRRQSAARGEDPFAAVDLPEMLLKLKQGAGRLIRSAQDRGVLALLDRSYLHEPWAEAVEATLPADAERTADITRLTL